MAVIKKRGNESMIRQKRYLKRNKARNVRTNLFLGLWMDSCGNGTFGALGKASETKAEIIWSILKDLTASNFIEPEKLKEYELALTNYNELVIPEVLEYKIVCI